jgi:thiopeptide-type bacteriocin biosynthesis protein
VHADLAPDKITSAVLEVLAGTPLDQAAAHAGMNPANLADAVEMYHAAGQAALQAHPASRDWFAVRIQPTDWDTAEHTAATHLGPHLRQAQSTGTLTAWWFVRKHPCWRLRLHPGPTTTVADLEVAFSTILDSLTKAGVLDRWWTAVYEPEVLAFGGPKATDIAHNLFHTDSRSILGYLRRQSLAARPEDVLGRRELSILLCSALFRSCSQDWYEQGDIWDRVARMRPLPAGIPTDRLPAMAQDLRRLLTVDTGQFLAASGPLGFAAPWAAGFREAGRDLADAAQHGALLRGMRDVLAHHAIFHWNRLGLSATTQAILARAARDAVMNPARTLARLAEDGR